jgi:C-terminal processing protease CtpA/Prc
MSFPLYRMTLSAVLLIFLLMSTCRAAETDSALEKEPFILHETYSQKQSTSTPIPPPTQNKGIVGMELRIQKGFYPQVQRIFMGTPAAQRGLLPGDILRSIDGIDTLDKTVQQVDELIPDVPGQSVRLSLQRGASLRTVILTVAPLEKVPSLVQPEFSILFGK